MAEILGLGTTDYPRIRSVDPQMTGPFKGSLNGTHMKEEMKEGKFDPKNPTIHVSGWGVISLEGLERWIKKDLTKIKETQKEEEQPTGGLMSRPTQEEDE